MQLCYKYFDFYTPAFHLQSSSTANLLWRVETENVRYHQINDKELIILKYVPSGRMTYMPNAVLFAYY